MTQGPLDLSHGDRLSTVLAENAAGETYTVTTECFNYEQVFAKDSFSDKHYTLGLRVDF